MSDLLIQLKYLSPYIAHKIMINDYILKRPDDIELFKRHASKDRNDYHVLAENHKFLWEEDDPTDTWEQQFVKRYYNKLFKEYCLGDLSRYKEKKIAFRWRVKKEVIEGKGQFSCGNIDCKEGVGLRSWEVNFGYVEHGKKKKALVKIRLCRNCSKKLNYHSQKKEVKRLQPRTSLPKKNTDSSEAGCSSTTTNLVSGEETGEENKKENVNESEINPETPWDNHQPIEQKSREEEMEEYLQNLLL